MIYSVRATKKGRLPVAIAKRKHKKVVEVSRCGGDLSALLRDLQRALGTGGTVHAEQGTVEVQGERSFNTQPTYVVSATDAKGESYFIYLADNWIHGGPAGLTDAAYVWLPMKFTDDAVVFPKSSAWTMDDPFAPSSMWAA